MIERKRTDFESHLKRNLKEGEEEEDIRQIFSPIIQKAIMAEHDRYVHTDISMYTYIYI